MTKSDTFFRLTSILSLIAIVVLAIYSENQEDRITRVEADGPCQVNPRSRECRELLDTAVLGLNHRSACSIVRRAGLRCKRRERAGSPDRVENKGTPDAPSPRSGSLPPSAASPGTGPPPSPSPPGASPGPAVPQPPSPPPPGPPSPGPPGPPGPPGAPGPPGPGPGPSPNLSLPNVPGVDCSRLLPSVHC